VQCRTQGGACVRKGLSSSINQAGAIEEDVHSAFITLERDGHAGFPQALGVGFALIREEDRIRPL
jgi:hypothetical protein